MQPVGAEVIFGLAVFEHRRDHINVMQIGALAGASTYRIVDLALKRKLRKPQLRGSGGFNKTGVFPSAPASYAP